MTTAAVFSLVNHIPVATIFMGKGAISEKDELCLGGVGLGFKDEVILAVWSRFFSVVEISHYDTVRQSYQRYEDNSK